MAATTFVFDSNVSIVLSSLNKNNLSIIYNSNNKECYYNNSSGLSADWATVETQIKNYLNNVGVTWDSVKTYVTGTAKNFIENRFKAIIFMSGRPSSAYTDEFYAIWNEGLTDIKKYIDNSKSTASTETTPDTDTAENGGSGSASNTTSSSSDSSDSSSEEDNTVEVGDYYTEVYTESEWNEEFLSYASKSESDLADVEQSRVKLVQHVFGMPYQFLPSADRRYLHDNGETLASSEQLKYMGRKYIERIASRGNILFITPGYPDFLKEASTDIKKSMMKTMITGDTTDILASLENDTNSYRFYSFKFDTSDYWIYLNPMLRAASRYLGIQAETLPGSSTRLDAANYKDYIAGEGTLTDNAYGALTFYIDGINSVSDSMSNNEDDSAFANAINGETLGIASTAREINYVKTPAVGMATGGEGYIYDLLSKTDVQSNVDNLNDFVDKYLFNNRLIKNVAKSAIALTAGGKIVFPRMWTGSSWRTSSKSVTIKCVSPDTDKLSIFWNILIPMYAAICLTAGHGIQGSDAYNSPFLVRAYCQSMFQIEMGLITGLSLQLGGEGYWTQDGLPTCIEIQMEITDMYQDLYISPGDKEYSLNPFHLVSSVVKRTEFMKNTAMLNYIANSCGVNLNKPDPLRDLEMYLKQCIVNPIGDIFPNTLNKLTDMLRNINGSGSFLTLLNILFKR
jgi:hypothetical protein